MDVYDNPNGESTGDIFDENGAYLSNRYIKETKKNGYYFVAAIVDKEYEIGTHHMVYYESSSIPINTVRYVSTSSGNVSTGSADQVSMFDTATDSFYYGFDCGVPGYNQANYKQNQTGFWGNDVDLILLDDNYKLTNTKAIDSLGKGKGASGQPICANVRYILSITNKFTLINEESKGIHIRIKVPQGSIYVDHETMSGETPNGVVEKFHTGNAFGITFDVESI